MIEPGDGSACFELPCFPLAGYDVPPKGVPVSGSPVLGLFDHSRLGVFHLFVRTRFTNKLGAFVSDIN